VLRVCASGRDIVVGTNKVYVIRCSLVAEQGW